MIALYAPPMPVPSEGDGPWVIFAVVVLISLILGAVETYDRLTGHDRWRNDR